MRRWARRALALAVALIVTFGIAALSRAPYTPPGADQSLLRLSWRMPAEPVEECRRPTAEELDRLPVHMRPEWICEGEVPPYRLRVELDGRLVVDETVRPAGLRGDRPFVVLRELSLEPGSYDLRVRWEREVGGGVTGELGEPGGPGAAPLQMDARPPGGTQPLPAGAGYPAPQEEHRSAVPERLALKATLTLAAGEIALVTYDLNRRVLVTRGHGLQEAGDG